MRPNDVPQCLPSSEIKARIWRLAQLINKRERKRGNNRPITPSGFLLLDLLLHKAPRRDGGLWPSEAELARALDLDRRTIQRCKAALIKWGLIIRHVRTALVAWPVKVGNAIHYIRKGMRTSDAYTFPDLKKRFPHSTRQRHFAAGGKASFRCQDSKGRFVSAATRDRLAKIAQEREAGGAKDPFGPDTAAHWRRLAGMD
jgi:hypothetical protein